MSLLGAVLVAILSGCGHSAHTLPTPSELPRSLKGVEVTSRLNDSLYRQTLRGEWDYEMHGEPHHK